MYRADFTPAFVRDRKRCVKKHWNIEGLDSAMALIVNSDEKSIPVKYSDHALKGNLAGYREMHVINVKDDWVLIYKIEGDNVIFTRTGTHDELF